MIGADARMLMKLWLRSPRRIATIAPSGRNVCGGLLKDLPRATSGWVVELGAGTGPVTTALLDAGLPPSRLLAVEANPDLAARLRARFGDDIVACHDATDMPTLFDRRGINRVAAIISTLPILNMPAVAQRAIIDGCFQRAESGATMTQITYMPGSPVASKRLHAWGYRADIAHFAWRNLPPATVWRYQRAR